MALAALKAVWPNLLMVHVECTDLVEHSATVDALHHPVGGGGGGGGGGGVGTRGRGRGGEGKGRGGGGGGVGN